MGALALVGASIGIGQLLTSKDVITARIAIGRAIISGGLGLCAGSLLTLFKELPLPALVGVAAVVTSLGTSAIERLFQRIIDGRGGGDGG